MAGPWDNYAPQAAAPAAQIAPPAAGPWDAYAVQQPQVASAEPAPSQQRGVVDQLLGIGGPRYQLAPERIGRAIIGGISGAAQLPGQYLQEATTPRNSISDSDVSVLSVPNAMNFAGMASPVTPGMRAGEGMIGAPLSMADRAKPPVPTAQQLKASGVKYIEAGKNSGLEVPGSAAADWALQQQQALFNQGIHPVRAGDTFAQLQDVANAPPGSIFTAPNYQSLRESLAGTAQNFNPTAAKDQLAASQSIKGLDQFVGGLDPESVVAGAPAATAQLFQRGRGDYAAAMGSNSLTGALDKATTGILERAEGRAQAANSGLNLDNTLRQKAESLLEKPKAVSGLSPDAMGALQAVVDGGPARNTARYIGNLLGGGGGLGHSAIGAIGAGMAAHEATGNIPLAIAGAAVPMATGTTARLIANALAKRSLNKADEVIRGGSPLYKEMLANAPSVPKFLTSQQAIARALMPYAFNQLGQPQQ